MRKGHRRRPRAAGHTASAPAAAAPDPSDFEYPTPQWQGTTETWACFAQLNGAIMRNITRAVHQGLQSVKTRRRGEHPLLLPVDGNDVSRLVMLLNDFVLPSAMDDPADGHAWLCRRRAALQALKPPTDLALEPFAATGGEGGEGAPPLVSHLFAIRAQLACSNDGGGAAVAMLDTMVRGFLNSARHLLLKTAHAMSWTELRKSQEYHCVWTEGMLNAMQATFTVAPWMLWRGLGDALRGCRRPGGGEEEVRALLTKIRWGTHDLAIDRPKKPLSRDAEESIKAVFEQKMATCVHEWMQDYFTRTAATAGGLLAGFPPVFSALNPLQLSMMLKGMNDVFVEQGVSAKVTTAET